MIEDRGPVRSFPKEGRLVSGFVAVEMVTSIAADGTAKKVLAIVDGTFSQDRESVVESYFNKVSKRITKQEWDMFEQNYCIREAKMRFSASDVEIKRGRPSDAQVEQRSRYDIYATDDDPF